MIKLYPAVLITTLISCNAFAVDSYYCQQNNGYVNVGMTEDQVVAACGQPLSKQDSNKPISVKIPMQQLMFSNVGTSSGSYNEYNLPASSAFYGYFNVTTQSTGASLEIDVVNDKVYSIVLNGNNSNAMSLCGGASIEVGDPASKVYYACGSPSVVNNTFINQYVQTNNKPQVWLFQPSAFQPTFTMTFVDGKLYSINPGS